MNSREYIQGIFLEIVSAPNYGLSEWQDAFVRAALEVSREVESPLKEEAIVRLVAMQVQAERRHSRPQRSAWAQ